MPKRVIDPSESELIRGVKLSDKSLTYFRFRNNIKTGFHEDYYPPYITGSPAMSFDEWIKGQDKEPLR
jgi:hypothetical protein